MEVSGQLRTPANLPRGYSRRYPFGMRLGGPQSRSGRGSEEKESPHCPYRNLKPGRPARSIISIPTELPRFP